MKHLAANALTVLIVCLIALAIGINWAKTQYQGPGPLETAVCLKVPSGGRFYEVSQDLQKMGAVSSGAIFRAGAGYQKRDHLLKAGSFLIEPGASMQQIVAQITTSGRSTCGAEVNYRIGIAKVQADYRAFDGATGQLELKASYLPGEEAVPDEITAALAEADLRLRITLAEGVTSWQVVNALKAADFLSGEVGAMPKEGMLAPQSYEVSAGDDRAALLAKMQERQAAIMAEAWAGRDEGLPLKSPEEMLILASIIEKETAIADERRTVAQVLINRLNKGMRLQFDPTIIYGITRGQGVLDRPIRQSDIDGRTEERQYGKIEYNTYQIDGLPAGPITNPGQASIEAAVHPDGSNYLYFVADGSGGHVFAATLDEHNANVRKWRAIESQGSGN